MDSGIAYDERMMEHRCLWDASHPENPSRMKAVLDRCAELQLLSNFEKLTSRVATDAEVLLVHSQAHLDLLKKSSSWKCEDDNLENISSYYDSIYFHPSTCEASLLSAGNVLELVNAICEKKIRNGMAVVRPPGHHAMHAEYNGFCFLNNVAIATRNAILNYKLSRILVVDFDVHHGQSTQRTFYNDSRVLYFSIHLYENGKFWPNLRESDFDYVGEGEGVGYNVNVPINENGVGDAEYMAIFHHLLMPIAAEFDPELIIVSAGYDAAIGCPEGLMNVTPACYGHMLTILKSYAAGCVAVVLEGGYCLKTLAEGVAHTLMSLLGYSCNALPSLDKPCAGVQETIFNVISVHRKYWKCFESAYQYYDLSPYDPSSKYEFSEETPETYPTRGCYPEEFFTITRMREEKINELISETKVLKPIHKLCYVYDNLMLNHQNKNYHPENPDRILEIYKKLEKEKLLDRMHQLPARDASRDELLLVHGKEYVDLLSGDNLDAINEKFKAFNSVYFHEDSYRCVRRAVGLLLQVVDSVVRGDSSSGVAIIRPPGHHADIDKPSGFCLVNNVGIAAKYAIQRHGLKRILILDWDVHHGNGTQNIFQSESNVLYISVHRYEKKFFPHCKSGRHSMTGEREGEKFNVNIPWISGGKENLDYTTVFQEIILPIAYEFNPELVIVSAGFDASIGDPIGGCRITPECFGLFTHWLKMLASGRIILALEGGYNLRSNAECMAYCCKELLGDPLSEISLSEGMNESTKSTIRRALQVHQPYWRCLLNPKDVVNTKESSLRSEELVSEAWEGSSNPPIIVPSSP